ncbi:MAG: YkgJ family cysteine cluster protein [Planctomycetes bacterium]|jgi:Fe-S-cluster containining protein|nr:YkgJ family cysteine cluster protein [Planctomycetota bacterium]
MTEPVEKPWYDAGLRFRCTMCGNCCTGTPGYVWVTDAETAAIAEFLGEPLDETIQRRTRAERSGRSLRERANGDCVFYDKQAGCTIYAVRPAQCRTWPFWESNLRSPKDWQHTCVVCPGSGQGELISVEEITQRLNVIQL